ncbi:hypothetical protein [Ligilactobacillus murinus]|uniref:Uncharacterized protein n=1 Tax=Ligilactobacillus murinus TaxID=1622 RepID=A0A4V3RP92_9LACO|nr:hypothetical protein [Ligilactobacillus murinus]MCR1890367.1 hypothetical protein [Ligilactobacillus murinus]TGY54620.1 hypothetical protein E5340_07345 [Ligilactobacillus murinus]
MVESQTIFFWLSTGISLGFIWTMWYWIDKYIRNLKLLMGIFIAVLLFEVNADAGFSFMIVIIITAIIILMKKRMDY